MFLRRSGVRHHLHKRPTQVLRAALRRVGARNARNYMRGCGLLVPEVQERAERHSRDGKRRMMTIMMAQLLLQQQ